MGMANIEVSRNRGMFTVIGYALNRPSDGKRERYRVSSKIKGDAVGEVRSLLENEGYVIDEVHDAVSLF